MNSKNIQKKCKGTEFLNTALRKFCDLSEDFEDKLSWLKKIKNKTLYDDININLIHINIAKSKGNISDLYKRYDQLISEKQKYDSMDNVVLLEGLGSIFFENYKLTLTIPRPYDFSIASIFAYVSFVSSIFFREAGFLAAM